VVKQRAKKKHESSTHEGHESEGKKKEEKRNTIENVGPRRRPYQKKGRRRYRERKRRMEGRLPGGTRIQLRRGKKKGRRPVLVDLDSWLKKGAADPGGGGLWGGAVWGGLM